MDIEEKNNSQEKPNLEEKDEEVAEKPKAIDNSQNKKSTLKRKRQDEDSESAIEDLECEHIAKKFRGYPLLKTITT